MANIAVIVTKFWYLKHNYVRDAGWTFCGTYNKPHSVRFLRSCGIKRDPLGP
jgi:hypothetical protein